MNPSILTLDLDAFSENSKYMLYMFGSNVFVLKLTLSVCVCLYNPVLRSQSCSFNMIQAIITSKLIFLKNVRGTYSFIQPYKKNLV